MGIAAHNLMQTADALPVYAGTDVNGDDVYACACPSCRREVEVGRYREAACACGCVVALALLAVPVGEGVGVG